MAAPAIPATSKCRVVVVDDEVAIASSLKAVLNHSGFDAHAMFGGQELVDSLETLLNLFLGWTLIGWVVL
jgi:PleD family two-component response regulator